MEVAATAAAKIANASEWPEPQTTPRIAPCRWDFITMPEEDQTTATGNVHKKIGKDRACGSEDMLADRQTDRQTDTHRERRAPHNTSPPLPQAK